MEPVQEKGYFGTADLVVFVGLLSLALLVGIFYAIKDRRKNDTENYYFGGRTMSPIPIGLSISVTFISALTVIAFPTEAYGYGSVTLWYSVGPLIPNIVACLYYIPLLHRLALSSIYEYLELRFHKGIRQLESVLSLLTLILYLGSTIYIPSLAISAVTPMSLTTTIILTSLVCIVYTTLGGMKAVVWTDTLQTFIMLAGMLAAFIKATLDVGGLQKVVEAIERGERQTIFNFTTDMTLPYTFWSMIAGYAFTSCGATCINQSINQRYLSCKSVKDARIAALVSVIPSFVFFCLAGLSGCVMYAYFEGCDPLKTGRIKKADQLMPLLVVSVFKDIPGMAGLFISAAFSGTLSTISSGINSVGALILQDFVLPKWPELSSRLQMMISKAIVAIFGLMAMFYAFCIQFIDATITQLSYIIVGVIGGPQLAVFTLGAFFPWCNTKGVLAGQIVGTIFMAWVAISSFVYGKPPEKYSFLPTSTDQCVEATTMWANSTHHTSTSLYTTASNTVETVEPRPALQDTLFAVSPFYYSMISFFITTLMALSVSFLTGANKPETMDPKLFIPMVDVRCLPEKVRLFFRFGVPEYRDESTAWKAGRQSERKAVDCQNSARDFEEDDVLMRTSAI